MSVNLDVMAFDDPLPEDVDATTLLGGKGAGLVEMTQALGLPIPPGFIITTEVCHRHLADDWPPDFKTRIAQHLEQLGQRLGRHFGEPTSPLLVSIRSGAPVSMPGMMDTLLNVGMTPAIRDQLALVSGSPVFAADTWLRFCRQYAEIVLGAPRTAIAAAAQSNSTPDSLLAAADRVDQLAQDYGSIPTRPLDQLWDAIDTVLRSWNSERAQLFRQREQIPDNLGTAITIQAMVFGNFDDQSGSGVVFTRNPSTGDPTPFGEYLARAQGEDVVAGTHAVLGLHSLQQQLPRVYTQLLDSLRSLERRYRDMCDVEFTISSGQLYLLQTRIGRRSPLAAVRIAVDMAEDPTFPLSQDEAVSRVDVETLHSLTRMGSVVPGVIPVAMGLAASPGVGVGLLCCDPQRAAELSANGKGVVLARSETSPADVHGMVGAAGLLTTLGGIASHAAVVARGWGIPAVVRLANAVVHPDHLQLGDQRIEEGETVTVDGAAGALYLGNQRKTDPTTSPQVLTLRRWAAAIDREPGNVIDPAQAPEQHTDVSLMEVARTVQLKGLCTVYRITISLSAAGDHISRLVAAHPSLFQETPRGLALTLEGRDWVTEQLKQEREHLDTTAVDILYNTQFLPLNHQFKQLVSDWQALSTAHLTDADWQTLCDVVTGLHATFRPLVDNIVTHLDRLSTYGPRFDSALNALRGGDQTMLASPLKDSYHTVWFEFHEELITLSGRNRAEEESR